jgi:HD superfamily phosphohydrolase
VALLHDIGHAPFSRASEDLFPLSSQGKQLTHEDFTEFIVKETAIKDIIDTHGKKDGITCDNILNLMGKKTLGSSDNFLKQILDSEVDVDRMDYLLRDSKFTGVQYGIFDLDRLIETLGIFEKPNGTINLGIERRGLHAVEGFILARYFMFLQLYFHAIRRIYDIHLSALIKELLKIQFDQDRYPIKKSEYLSLDDDEVLHFARTAYKDSDNAKIISDRSHYVISISLVSIRTIMLNRCHSTRLK